jgi:hypothetical protein
MRALAPDEVLAVNGGYGNLTYDDPDFPAGDEPGGRYPRVSRFSWPIPVDDPLLARSVVPSDALRIWRNPVDTEPESTAGTATP